MRLVKILVVLYAALFVNQFSISATSSSLIELLKDMKLYKTQNYRFHAGHLYEHSVWVTRSVINLLESEWAEGIDIENVKRPLIIAGLLHDIGKGGDLKLVFFEKIDHPINGFNYLLGYNQYKIYSPKYTFGEENIFDFDQLFYELNFSRDERTFIALIAAMHHDLGMLMRGPGTRYNTRLENKRLYEKTLSKLDALIEYTGYKGGSVSRNSFDYIQLICCICLVSTADVCAAQVVEHDKEKHAAIQALFGIDLSEQANQHCKDLSQGFAAFHCFDYRKLGFNVRKQLIKYAVSGKHVQLDAPYYTLQKSQSEHNHKIIEAD